MGLQPGITQQHREGMEDPIRYYSPAIGPSGIVFNYGDRYPGWSNNLFLTALTGQKLIRYEIEGRRITEEEVLWDQYGRTRDVIMGPDGLLYILLQNATGSRMSTGASSPGMVLRTEFHCRRSKWPEERGRSRSLIARGKIPICRTWPLSPSLNESPAQVLPRLKDGVGRIVPGSAEFGS